MNTQIDIYSKTWNIDQKHFRTVLESHTQHEKAIELFLIQHGVLHSAKVAPETLWSFEDMLFENLSDESFRRVPRGAEHSIAWLIWHLARIEDITMNILTAGRLQVLEAWQPRLQIKAVDAGNNTTLEEVMRITQQEVDVD